MDREIEKLYRAVDALNEWVNSQARLIETLEEELALKDEEISRLGKLFILGLEGGEVITWDWAGREESRNPGPIKFIGYVNGWIVYRMAYWFESAKPALSHIDEVCNLRMWNGSLEKKGEGEDG